jgi:tripartite-type tricarboxylate transporter receptor subunit TctC
VPFRGGGERTVSLAGGHIDADFDIMAPLKTMQEAGKVRVLAIAAEQRSKDYPTIPTMAEGGVNLAISSWHGIFAPRGTPPAIVRKVSDALGRVAAKPEFQKRMHDLLLGVYYLDSAHFRAFFAEADKVNLDLIRQLGLLVATPNAAK